MYSLFNLLLFYTWIITSCASLQRDAGRASHLGIFLAYLGFWLLSSAPFLFCWEFLHSVCISTDSSGNGSGQMANVAWHALERKALLTMTLQSFQLPMRLKLHHVCPSLRCPGTPVSSHLGRILRDMCQRLWVTSLSTTCWRCWCLWQRKMTELGRHGLAMLYQ